MEQELLMEPTHELKETTGLEKHIQTVLVSIILAAIIGCFVKINSMSEMIVRMEERDKSKNEQIDKLQTTMNKVQLDLIDLKDRMTRMEITDKK